MAKQLRTLMAIPAAAAALALAACGASSTTAADTSSTTASMSMPASSTMSMGTGSAASSAGPHRPHRSHPTTPATAPASPTTPKPSAPVSHQPTKPAAPTVQLTIHNFAFQGASTVPPGATVRVTNRDSEAHTVTSDDGRSFDVKVSPGGSATFTAPTKPGAYPYHCKFHASMHGSLKVS